MRDQKKIMINRLKFRYSIAFIVFSVSSLLYSAEDPSPGQVLYMKHCATCHGLRLQGGNAQSLVDAVWQFGAGRGDITRNIKFGIPHLGMPSYEKTLSDREISQLVAFLLETESKSGAVKPAPAKQLETMDYQINASVFADKLSVPWAIDFIDDQTALITERPGRLRVVKDGIMQAPVANTPQVLNEGQGGLLDVAVDPEYVQNGWIYLSYSHALENPSGGRPTAMTRIVRGRIKDNIWTDQQVLFEAPHETYLTTRHHYGSRIVFDPEGFLYFSIGERGMQDHAQDLSRPNGKIHRIHRNGSIPKDNPFVNTKDAMPSIFSYGHRNPQGLAIHPVTGELWSTEHGPLGGDELNLCRAGKNYGWPVITYGRNYNGTIISEYEEKPGYEQPIMYWKPSTALCGMNFYRGNLFGKWKNHLLITNLKYEDVRVLDIKENRVLHEEVILKNAGRVRDVADGPDGAIYVVLNNPDAVLRLTAEDN